MDKQRGDKERGREAGKPHAGNEQAEVTVLGGLGVLFSSASGMYPELLGMRFG